MRAFLSHNKADKETTRLLAASLAMNGIDVWFDEWKLRPGDSITGGIEEGLENSDIFILFWSQNAQASNWVGTELRAFITRKVNNKELRVIPIMIDETPLPVLVAEYLGFSLKNIPDLNSIATKITGNQNSIELAQQLQKRLHEIEKSSQPKDFPISNLVCPKCACKELKREFGPKEIFSRDVYFITCTNEECIWGDSKSIGPDPIWDSV